jgi:uncharacterized membrane protein YkvA (DUF1232 family)
VLAGQRTEARALAGFVPDCAVLFGRLIRDSRVSRWRKLVPIPLAAYLAMAFDLIPDFIPVAGQLDDALVVALALRLITSGADASVIRRNWPGPQNSVELVLRLLHATRPCSRPLPAVRCAQPECSLLTQR